jgi:hypothetical protein
MGRVLAALVVALLVAGAGCAEGEDSGSGGSYSSGDWAKLVATPTAAPGTWGALPYDQKHNICQEASETVQQTANEVSRGIMLGMGQELGEGRSYDPGELADLVAKLPVLWPRAQAMFYDQCMECGGPTEVIAHADQDRTLHVECATEGGIYPRAKSIPEGNTRIWP